LPPLRERIANLAAEAAVAQLGGCVRDQFPIEPSGAVRTKLPIERQGREHLHHHWRILQDPAFCQCRHRFDADPFDQTLD
jgi:hypothetical protein